MVTVIITGWWFGTCVIFPYIGNVIIPTDEHIFQRGRSTTNQKITYESRENHLENARNKDLFMAFHAVWCIFYATKTSGQGLIGTCSNH